MMIILWAGDLCILLEYQGSMSPLLEATKFSSFQCICWYLPLNLEIQILLQFFYLLFCILHSLSTSRVHVNTCSSQCSAAVQSLSCVWLFVTLWTVVRQAPLSMGLSRQEYWSGLSFSSPGNHPRIKLMSPAWQVDSLALGYLESLIQCYNHFVNQIYCWLILNSFFESYDNMAGKTWFASGVLNENFQWSIPLILKIQHIEI